VPDATVVVLTRARDDNADLAVPLRAGGATVIELPCVRTVPLDDLSELARAIAALGRDDWLVVTSRAGADAVSRVGPGRARVAAIGVATAERLRKGGIAVAFQPSTASGERLARELPAARAALLARSDRALADLPAILRSRGFEVREEVAYRTVARATGDVAAVRAALGDARRTTRVYVSSPSAVEGFIDAVGGDLAARATFVASGHMTAAAVRLRVATARVEPQEEELTHVAHR